MNLKYQIELSKLPDQPCPCLEMFIPRSVEVFRFMNQNATALDFVPPAIKTGIKESDRCKNFALSFFSTLESARSRYIDLNKKFDAASRYGSSIGKINLLSTDGLCSHFEKQHMDFHPNTGVVFHNRIIEYYPANITISQEGHNAS